MTAIRLLMSSAALAGLVACEGTPDADLRDLANGFDTSDAVANIAPRPSPDSRGVISYPTYQVAVARNGDTVQSVAERIGANAGELARFNGISPDTTLRAGELIAIAGRVPDGATVATPSAPAATAAPLDVSAIATTALDRAGVQTSTAPATPAPVSTGASNASAAAPVPVRHQVQRGETVFSVARLYNVPVSTVAEWNGLGSDLTVREGQFLLIPQAGARPPVSAIRSTPPGTGSPTPLPPSAATALPAAEPTRVLPAEATPAAPDLGPATESIPEPPPPPRSTPPTPSSAGNSSLIMPVSGPIIRDYAPGKNDGIDIGAPAGTSVKAAAAGSVAAVTTDTNGIAIVVVRHDGGLLTVYTNLENLSVEKGSSVRQGQTLGQVRAGEPSFVHFETRRGLQAIDPNTLLP